MFRFDDSCGVYYPFQKDRNVPVECNSDESHTPGADRETGRQEDGVTGRQEDRKTTSGNILDSSWLVISLPDHFFFVLFIFFL